MVGCVCGAGAEMVDQATCLLGSNLILSPPLEHQRHIIYSVNFFVFEIASSYSSSRPFF